MFPCAVILILISCFFNCLLVVAGVERKYESNIYNLKDFPQNKYKLDYCNTPHQNAQSRQEGGICYENLQAPRICFHYNGYWYKVIPLCKNLKDAKQYCKERHLKFLFLQSLQQQVFYGRHMCEGESFWTGLELTMWPQKNEPIKTVIKNTDGGDLPKPGFKLGDMETILTLYGDIIGIPDNNTFGAYGWHREGDPFYELSDMGASKFYSPLRKFKFMCISTVKDCNIEKSEGWANWLAWGDCSAKCGGGVRKRNRVCFGHGEYCQGGPVGKEACNEQDCPPGWTQWTPWNGCSESCNGGYKETRRGCVGNWTIYCNNGPKVIRWACNTHRCPYKVDHRIKYYNGGNSGLLFAGLIGTVILFGLVMAIIVAYK